MFFPTLFIKAFANFIKHKIIFYSNKGKIVIKIQVMKKL